ncbi:DUF2905 domain-containing protein [Anditalea andensis]|uniref:DUF2905 domain-containing protein n=1 Tax=Anditalea andensis TaxID=1048983 RepID=A0A074L2Q9_9BACT|nr:DUF2905 domain-containing protein [Anditalea andensis]KEO74118.1 hypothetical protein EL17_08215 [Anditalea andensis]
MDNGLPLLAKILIYAGVLLIIGGLVVWSLSRFTDFRSMPGDMVFKRENFSLYFPLGTSILISVLLTLILFLWRKFSG